MATTKTESRIKNQESSEKAVKSVKADKVEAVIQSAQSARRNPDSIKIATSPATPRNDASAISLRDDKKGGLSVPVFTLEGKESGSLDLPKTIFGVEVNEPLLKQALRVYLNNAKGHYSNTKTRGEVTGSTRKIYKQKGTGRARHGGITAPIFVGGGIALGPKSRRVTLSLSKKMKKAALINALSQKVLDKQIFALSGLDKATGKTAEFAAFIKNINQKSTLIVTDKVSDMAERASSNLKNVRVVGVTAMNALEVIKTQSLIFTKEAVDALEKKISEEAK